MNSSAQPTILITEAGSYLGSELAKAYLQSRATVYGIAQDHLPKDLLSHQNFTMLEIDLSQPLPAYLPNFDIVFDLSAMLIKHGLFSQIPSIPPQTTNIISRVKGANIFVFSKITTSEEFYDYLSAGRQDLVRGDLNLKKHLKLLLVGDLYGPGMPTHDENELANLIWQAARTDKVILADEGLRQIYPTYINDAVGEIIQIEKDESEKKIHYVVSEKAKTSLTCAYEIQDVSRLALGKELDLFFAGPQKQIQEEPEIVIKTHDVPIVCTTLRDGLRLTFQYFVESHQVAKEQITQNPGQKQEVPRHHVAAFALQEKRSTPLMKKFPKVNIDFNFRFKNIFLIILLILTVAVAKTALDLYLGVRSLESAKTKLESGDFKGAAQKAKSSQKSFHAAGNKTKILPLQNINAQIFALENGAAAATYFVEASEALSKNFYIITHADATEQLDLETPSADFQKAQLLSAQAASQLQMSAPKSVMRSKILQSSQQFASLSHLSQNAYELSNLLTDLTGAGTKKTYLILLQNNTELRPGGGFIGNYATLEFDSGKLKNIAVDDIYNIDGQLKEKIEPPKELKEKLGTTQLYLRDSNWSPDNSLNAQTERDLFKKETGKEVNGVIAIDLTFIQEILAATGTIRLEDFKEDITAKNLFEKGEYYSEIGFFPGSTQKKDFFGALSRALIAKILGGLSQNGQSGVQTAFLTAIKDGLAQKHIMLTFDNPNISTYIATHTWNQPVPPLSFNPTDDSKETRDFLAISEANLGANKVNRFVDRKISYEMTIGRDADLVAKLKIAYTNNSQAETWPGGKYTNFLRVYVPQNSGLLEVKNGDNTDLKSVQTLSQGYLTAFATYVEVPIKSTKEITLTYRIPKNIKLETTPTYHLYISKQPGTDKDPLTFTFNLPQYLVVKSINGNEAMSGKQNVITDSNLLEDKQFGIEVAKK